MKMTLIPVIVCKILAVKVIVLIQIFTPEVAPRKYYFLDSFKKFCKIPKKTFRKRSMFVTASDFWFTTLLKLLLFLQILQILLEQLNPIIPCGCFYVMSFYDLSSIFGLKSSSYKTIWETVENHVEYCNFLFLSGYNSLSFVKILLAAVFQNIDKFLLLQ